MPLEIGGIGVIGVEFSSSHLITLVSFRTNDLQLVKLLDLDLQRLLSVRLAMYQEDLPQCRHHRLHPFQKLPLVRMPAQLTDRVNLGPQTHRLAEDLHL